MRGKLTHFFMLLPPTLDHPRRCGENTRFATENCVVAGSPPQVRGKLGEWEQRKPIYRITPAGAGKTARVHPELFAVKDHPRRCGENFPIVFAVFQCARITPAGAGKTNGFYMPVAPA